MKKLLSLILTLCLIFTTISSIAVVSAQDVTITQTFNVEQGTTYTLPSGGRVDISNPGYQIVQDTDGKWYRVNVGTYGVILYDDMDAHSTVMNADGLSGKTTTGDVNNLSNLYISHPKVGSDGNAYTQRFENLSDNSVLSLGKWTDWVKWQLTDTAKPIGAFRVSYDMKVDRYNLSTVTRGALTFRNAFTDGAAKSHSIFYLRLYMTTDKQTLDGDKMKIRPYGANSSGGGDIAISPSYEITTDNKGENILTTDWINVLFDVQSNGKFKIYINGTDVTTGTSQESTYTLGENFKLASVDFYNNGKGQDTKFLVDNVKITTNSIVYPSSINQTTLTDSVYSGIKNGKVSVPVTMSDNTTQSFTANYTLTDAQSSTEGTYDVEATIPGFSEKVTVAVTVKKSDVVNKTINTYKNAMVTFPTTLDTQTVVWKNFNGESVATADTGVIGRKYYAGTIADGRTVTYTVNIGEYNLKLEDKMSTHTNTTNEDGLNTINPGAWDGFTLEMYNVPDQDAAKHSAIVGSESNGNTYLQVTDMTPANNTNWLVKDAFNGDYKVTYDVKIENATTTASYFPYRFMVLDTKGKMIGSAALYVSGNRLYMRGNKYNGSLTSYDVTSLADWSVTDGVGNSKWCTVEILVRTVEQTFDIIFEGTTTHSGLPFLANEQYGAGTTDGTLGSVSFDRRQDASTSATAMIDNVEIHTYNCFTDELAEAIDVITPVGKSTVEIPLVLSNGGVKNFTMMLPCDVSKIARFGNVDATIVGFDGNVKANVKVANYQINGVNLKSGSEFATAPVAGGAVESVNIKKLTDAAAQTAIFVLYSQNDDIKAIKTVDISSLKKDEESVIAVNMALPENTTKGDYIRVYVWDSKAKLQPLDLITDLTFDYDAAPDVYVAAASMYQTYSKTANPSQWPKMGIGQALSDYVSDDVSVINLAKSGAATHTFINDGLWNRILANVKTGDYVIVAFGGNDQVKCTDETHSDGCAFKTNTRYFIESLRAKGANPIISTPAARRVEGINGVPAFDRTSHKHLTTAKQIADELDVPFIDLTTLTMNYLQSLDNEETESVNEASEESKKLYMVDLINNMSSYEEDALWATSRYNPNGSVKDTNYTTDNSHFTHYGAKIYAKILASELAKLNNNLSKFIVNTDANITYPALD